jgi:hypothetical protein
MSRKKQAKAEIPSATGPVEHIVVGAVEPGGSTSYMVPAEVAIALNTGRSQFITGLVGRVRKGHVIEPVQVIGMLELIRDWTDARYADDRRNTVAKENLAASRANMAELRIQVNKLTRQLEDTIATATRVAHRHGAGPLGPEDDTE